MPGSEPSMMMGITCIACVPNSDDDIPVKEEEEEEEVDVEVESLLKEADVVEMDDEVFEAIIGCAIEKETAVVALVGYRENEKRSEQERFAKNEG